MQQIAGLTQTIEARTDRANKDRWANQVLSSIDPNTPAIGGADQLEAILQLKRYEREAANADMINQLRQAQMQNMASVAAHRGQMTPYQQQQVALAQDRERRLAQGQDQRFQMQNRKIAETGLKSSLGKPDAGRYDIGRAALAVNQEGLEPGNVRVWVPVVGDDGKQVIGSGQGGSFQHLVIPESEWQAMQGGQSSTPPASPIESPSVSSSFSPALQNGQLPGDSDLPTGGGSDEAGLMGRSPAADPRAIAIQQAYQSGQISRDDAKARLQAMGY